MFALCFVFLKFHFILAFLSNQRLLETIMAIRYFKSLIEYIEDQDPFDGVLNCIINTNLLPFESIECLLCRQVNRKRMIRLRFLFIAQIITIIRLFFITIFTSPNVTYFFVGYFHGHALVRQWRLVGINFYILGLLLRKLYFILYFFKS